MINFLLFYNTGYGKQSRMTFHEEFRHCDIITFDGDFYLWLSWNNKGIETRRVKATSCTSLIRALRIIPELTALIVADCDVRVNTWYCPLVVRSCNEFARYVSGLDIGFTLNPQHLYKKVLKYQGKRNFQILRAWRRSDHVMGRQRG